MFRKVSLADIQKIVSRHGGELISENSGTLHLKCRMGHAWNASPAVILRGLWCPKCDRQNYKVIALEKLKQLAQERNGICLSENYERSDKKLLWQCAKSHQWKADSHSIKKGSWCPTCSREGMKNTIEDMQALAKKRNGKCLSSSYVNNETPIQWQCNVGHTWKARPTNVVSGQWCPTCQHDSMRLSLFEIKTMAEKRGGKCLSDKYTSNRDKLLWECSKGHQWRSSVNNVKHHSWCPKCANNQAFTITTMNQYAAVYGGRCLSSVYLNSKSKLKWQCKNGHVFTKSLEKLKRCQNWCSVCFRGKSETKRLDKKIASS